MRAMPSELDQFDELAWRFAAVLAALILFFVFRHRHGVDAGEPAVEVDVGATLGAERPERRDHRFAASRAFGTFNVAHRQNMGGADGGARARLNRSMAVPRCVVCA